MIRLFALVVLSALPDTAALDRARDLEFERITVAWIASTTRVPSLESVIPRHHAELVRLLGDPRHLVRELAADRLAGMGHAASTALAWGMRVRDPEIVRASMRLRDRLYWCPACNGSGKCSDRRVVGNGEVYSRSYPCHTCQGSGDIRYTVTQQYTPEGPVWVVEERNLFGRP